MKWTMVWPLFLSLMLLPVVFVKGSWGADHYVRTDGSDSNDGSADDAGHAWRTIAHAESRLTNGAHTVHIAAGTYPEEVTIDVSGTGPSDRITFIGSDSVYVNRLYLGNPDNTGEADYITLSNLIVGIDSNPSTYSIIHVNRTSDYAIITGCTIGAHNAIGLEGVSLYGDHGILTGSTVQNIDNTYAVSVGEGDRRDGSSTNGIVATRNIIQNNKDSDAFRIHGINHTISDNEVRNIEKDAVVDRNHGDFVQWFPNDNDCANSPDVRNILIEGNYVHDANVQVWYGNNVCESYGTIVDNIIFRNNIFYKVGMQSQDHGETVTNIKVYNNVFHTVGCLYYSFGNQRTYSTHAISFSSKSSGVEVRNNIFLNCGDEPAVSTKGWYATNNPSGFSASNNYVGGPLYAVKNTNPVYDTYWAEPTSSSINGGDPRFVDEANHHYRLAAGSPLINAGTTIAGFSTDKAGTLRPQGSAWDIGAYEYVASGVGRIMADGRSKHRDIRAAGPNPLTMSINYLQAEGKNAIIYDIRGKAGGIGSCPKNAIYLIKINNRLHKLIAVQ